MTTSQQEEGKNSKFTSKKFLKSFISGMINLNEVFSILILKNTGGLAGIAAKSTIAPFERIKILFLVRNP